MSQIVPSKALNVGSLESPKPCLAEASIYPLRRDRQKHAVIFQAAYLAPLLQQFKGFARQRKGAGILVFRGALVQGDYPAGKVDLRPAQAHDFPLPAPGGE